MKEIMAIIRLNKINQTKEALMFAGFPSITVCKALGRGKAKVDFALVENILSSENIEPQLAEQLSECHRLIPKRLLTAVVNDEDVKKAVDTIMSVNSSGNPGDGKIFVLPLAEVVRIRTGELDQKAI